MSTHTEINKAIVSVMKSVRGMEKNSRVGSGNQSYDGTRDQDVKEAFNVALAENGLCILPTSVEDETEVSRWTEDTQWGPKQKQSVFTKVRTKYLLLHESGESIELAGYGHGVDPQDKGAGKALTYALKNCLLYAFLTPVGKIDDTDTTHSNDIEAPATQPAAKKISPEEQMARRLSANPELKWFEVSPFKKGEFKDVDLGAVAAAEEGLTQLKSVLKYIDDYVLDYPIAKERLDLAITEATGHAEGGEE